MTQPKPCCLRWGPDCYCLFIPLLSEVLGAAIEIAEQTGQRPVDVFLSAFTHTSDPLTPSTEPIADGDPRP